MTIRTAMLCDGCDAVFVPEDTPARHALVPRAHEAGWTSSYHDGKWQNHCPDHTSN